MFRFNNADLDFSFLSFQIALTSGLILVGQESRATVGVTCVLASLYAMLFAYTAPIQDFFENKLMVTALSVTFVNLGIGAVSRIPAENRPPAEDPLLDTIIFKITVVGANTLVIGQLIRKSTINLPWPPNKRFLQVSQSGYANLINGHAS